MVDQRRIDNQPEDFLDAKAAAKLLGVAIRTLYAYASRGLVRSVRRGRGRERMYARADLDRLKARSSARAGHGAVAAGALRWGEPVLDSAITAITPRGPAYRGRLATELAATQTRFENVAELLWSGYLPAAPIAWPRPAVPLAQLARLLPIGASPLDVMSVLVPLAARDDPSRHDDRPDAIIACGRRLVGLLAAALGWTADAAHVTRALSAPSIAAIAARALGLDDDAAPAIETTLIVLADHELNASSFAARIAASTDADPYACFAAALATHSGRRHGSAAEEIARFADELGSPERAARAARALRAAPAGFGHPLYPGGDPRTAPLLDLARGSTHQRARTLVALADTARKRELYPSVDVGLAALVAAFGLAPAAGSGLFAVARSAGWLAHVLEQRTQSYVLRPRARYVGVATP
ncbi:MAG: citrate/2-methylcitrate synthase [Kofleriaceae bacterium]